MSVFHRFLPSFDSNILHFYGEFNNQQKSNSASRNNVFRDNQYDDGDCQQSQQDMWADR